MESSSTLNARQEILATFFSRITRSELQSLPARFDIPSSYSLVAPTRSEVIFQHGGRRNPLYIKHLEFGLRLPLHPFVDVVCTALGISPVQLKPNAIATLMAYIVICHWVGLEPSLSVLSHLISVRVYKKEPHYHFHNVTSFKLVEGLPDSIKDWKENFVWIEGEDLGLFCASWPEAIKDGLKAKALSSADEAALEKVKTFAGSRRLADIFDNSVLRVAGISPIKPSAKDLRRATRLILGISSVSDEPGASRSEDREGPSSRPAKRLREDVPRAPPPKDSDTSPLPTTAIIHPAGKTADLERRQRSKASSRGSKGIIKEVGGDAIVTGGSPKEGGQGSRLVTPPCAQATSGGTSIDIPVGQTHRRGKEPSTEEAPPADERSIREDLGWPHPYRLDDVGEADWAKLRRSLLGTPPAGPQYDRDPRAEDRYTPTQFLDKRASVLESRRAQATAVEQFWLPRDREILGGIPDVGLHQILRSYLVRGALVEEEVFRRLSVVKERYGKLQAVASGSGVEEGSDLEKALLEVSAKEEELATWKGEMEVKEKMIEDLKASNAEKAVELEKLRNMISGSAAKTGQSDLQINEALFERDRALVQVDYERQAVQSAKQQFEDERLAHERTRAENARLGGALERALAQITHLESPAWRKEVVDEYRLGLIGRAEVTLACKAGYDYLWAQLPAEMKQDDGRFHYPPRIANCVEVLEDIERQGGTLNLDEEDDREDVPAESIRKVNEDSPGQLTRLTPVDRANQRDESLLDRPSGDDGAALTSTPHHSITSELPLTPGADIDLP